VVDKQFRAFCCSTLRSVKLVEALAAVKRHYDQCRDDVFVL
jgi:hypothetical protein